MYLGGPPNATNKKKLPSGCLQKILELTGKLALVVDDHLRCLASHEIGGLVQIPNFSRRFITTVQIHKVARDIAEQHKIYITKTSTRLELLKFHLRSGFLDPDWACVRTMKMMMLNKRTNNSNDCCNSGVGPDVSKP